MRITNKIAYKLGRLFNINFDYIPLQDWKDGLQIELEHGTKYYISNITNDNLIMTAKIVLAHFMESPLYYKKLKQMEKYLESKINKKHHLANLFKQDPKRR